MLARATSPRGAPEEAGSLRNDRRGALTTMQCEIGPARSVVFGALPASPTVSTTADLAGLLVPHGQGGGGRKPSGSPLWRCGVKARG